MLLWPRATGTGCAVANVLGFTMHGAHYKRGRRFAGFLVIRLDAGPERWYPDDVSPREAARRLTAEGHDASMIGDWVDNPERYGVRFTLT